MSRVVAESMVGRQGSVKRPRKGFLACALVGLGLVVLRAPAVAEVQRFTDEAGELLYTIDAQGVVSMFENAPGTDVTLDHS